MKAKLLLLILIVGCFQIAGHATGSKILRGLGLISGISPYPKVFCEADGYEAFAARFAYQGENEIGETITIPIGPELYSKLDGPYHRRNVYGAALAFAPRLPQDLRAQLFGEMQPLLSALNLPELKNPRILIEARRGESCPRYTFPLTH